MTMHITDFAKSRHTAKAYAPERRISDADMQKVRDLLRLSPSSVNIQPWHFVIASTDAGKERVAKAAAGTFSFNAGSIRDASHVIVFAGRIDAEDAYLETLLAQEEADGRFAGNPEEFKPAMRGARKMFTGIHRDDLKDVQSWMAQQVYLNLGQFLLGVAALGIDATPMEGIDTEILDAEFGLREKGYTSLFVVPIGYSDPEGDYNAQLPKSRLPEAEIMTEV